MRSAGGWWPHPRLCCSRASCWRARNLVCACANRWCIPRLIAVSLKVFLNRTEPLVAIVDDDPSVRGALKRLVRSLGMLARTFSSGQQFLDHLAAEPSQETSCVVL